MRAETQRELVARVLALHADQTTMMTETTLRIPAAHYTCEDHARRERFGWFLDQPHVVALGGELPEAGDYVAYEFAGVPIVVVPPRRRGASLRKRLPSSGGPVRAVFSPGGGELSETYLAVVPKKQPVSTIRHRLTATTVDVFCRNDVR